MRYIFKIDLCQIIINIDKKIAWDENMAKEKQGSLEKTFQSPSLQPTKKSLKTK